MVSIRPGRDSDADGFIGLIGACWGEYPGVILDVDGELPELYALASHYAGKGGALWTAEAADGRIVGMLAASPRGESDWEISRMYVLAAWRGDGLAQRLLDLAEAHATGAGAARLVLWSDTRFDRAHRFYEKHGYVRHGPIRVLNDVSHSLEFGYAKPIEGIELLDAAAAASAERLLADLLVACVDAGASVSFLSPLAPQIARGYFRRVATQVAGGGRLLLAAWSAGVPVGMVMLDLDTPANQPHRAEVKKLLVHPAVRRLGLGRALMRRVEQEARRVGRSLLTLDTRAGDAGAALYRSLGWHEAGRIPGYTLDGDGTRCDTVWFWRELT